MYTVRLRGNVNDLYLTEIRMDLSCDQLIYTEVINERKSFPLYLIQKYLSTIMLKTSSLEIVENYEVEQGKLTFV